MLIQPPASARQHGFEHSVLTSGALSMLKFQLWPFWEYVYIGKHLGVIEKVVVDYEKEKGLVPGGQGKFL